MHIVGRSVHSSQPFFPAPSAAQTQDRTIRRMATLTKRMLPLKLSALKRALYAVTGSRHRAAIATAAAATMAPPAPSAPASPATLAKLPAVAQGVAASAAAPLAFRDGTTITEERIRQELEAAVRAPLPRIPQLPSPAPKMARRSLEERRKAAGLKPGQLDPSVLAPSRRDQELIDRKVSSVGFEVLVCVFWGAGVDSMTQHAAYTRSQGFATAFFNCLVQYTSVQHWIHMFCCSHASSARHMQLYLICCLLPTTGTLTFTCLPPCCVRLSFAPVLPAQLLVCSCPEQQPDG